MVFIRRLFSFIFCSTMFLGAVLAQEQSVIKGLLLDAKTEEPLPYANVAILNKSGGTITNEVGEFSIDIATLEPTDSISFLFIGYGTKNIAINDFKQQPTVYLKEEVFNLSETFVFAEEKNPEEIIKKVLENKSKNYQTINKKSKVFIRSQYVSDLNHFKINFKKSSFKKLDKKMTELIERKMPKHSVSYSDFLGNIYFSKGKNDTLKVLPIKMVSLKEKDISDLSQLQSTFENLFKNTKEKEYWKIKSGILGSKIDIDNQEDTDSLKKDKTPKFQSKYFRSGIQSDLNNLIDNKKQWEFLHSTNKYSYTLAGGTSFNGENVYIIDFEPTKKGKYIGRAYISMETYALVKADYSYAPGKIGANINMLGIGYTKNIFTNSISYEKKDGKYSLKYYSIKEGEKTSINRNVSLLKKRERFLIDKKMNEIKVKLDISANSKSTKEYLVLSEEETTSKAYLNAKQPKYIKVIYVDKFDDNLWKGHTTIQPTKQMKEYKKQGF